MVDDAELKKMAERLAAGAKEAARLIKEAAEGFSEETVAAAFKRAGGRCECTRKSCKHSERCSLQFKFDQRCSDGLTGWQAHHRKARSAGGGDDLANCEILCVNCHMETDSFGRNAK